MKDQIINMTNRIFLYLYSNCQTLFVFDYKLNYK